MVKPMRTQGRARLRLGTATALADIDRLKNMHPHYLQSGGVIGPWSVSDLSAKVVGSRSDEFE